MRTIIPPFLYLHFFLAPNELYTYFDKNVNTVNHNPRVTAWM